MILAQTRNDENTVTGFEHLETCEMLEAIGQDLIENLTINKLNLGYLCLEATKDYRYGEGGLKQFANLIGADGKSQLYAYRRVASCFSPDESAAWLEIKTMQWSHLAASVILHDKSQREAFLDHCWKNNISTTQAKVEAQKWRDGVDSEHIGRVLLYDGDDVVTAREILTDCYQRGVKVMVKIFTAD